MNISIFFDKYLKIGSRILSFSGLLFFDFKNLVLIAGMIVRDKNVELKRAALIVRGNDLRNSPTMPLTRSIGKKAKTVVRVPDISGHLKV